MKKTCLIILAVFVFIVALSALAALLSHEGGVSLADKVALIYVRGAIFDAEDTIEQIKKYDEDDSIKAIILRVDSPGGAVAPSQEIFTEVKRVAGNKPVIASMGTVAASGGYYISAPASKIIANPGTLTGSIGVIMEIPNMENLMDKVGIETEVIKSGPHKDIASAMRQMTDEDRKILQGIIDNVYEQFIVDVAESRDIPLEEVRELADGRIYTGQQALELKLVDELGGLERAIDVSAELAGIEGEPSIVTTKEDKGLLDLLVGRFSANMQELIPHIKVKYILSP